MKRPRLWKLQCIIHSEVVKLFQQHDMCSIWSSLRGNANLYRRCDMTAHCTDYHHLLIPTAPENLNNVHCSISNPARCGKASASKFVYLFHPQHKMTPQHYLYFAPSSMQQLIYCSSETAHSLDCLRLPPRHLVQNGDFSGIAILPRKQIRGSPDVHLW